MKNGVTVIVPTIGRIEKLKVCLESLFDQKLKPQEIIVVDNSINKEVKQLIRKVKNNSQIKLRYVLEKRKGASYARNRGIKEAKNRILAFIDDDCQADINWLKELLSAYLINKEKAIIKGNNKNGENNNAFSCVEYGKDELFFRSKYYTNGKNTYSLWLDSKNFIVNKSLITKNRLFFKKYLIFEDLDFALQARKVNIPIVYSKQAIVFHYPSTGITGNLLRWVDKGKDNFALEQNWPVLKDHLTKSEANLLKIFKKYYQEKKISQEILRGILLHKNFLFRIKFYLFLWTSINITKLTYFIKRKNLLSF